MGKSRYEFVKNVLFVLKIFVIIISYDLQEKAQKSMPRMISKGYPRFKFTILMFFEAEKEAFGPLFYVYVLSYLLSEAKVEHYSCTGEAEGEGEPDTCQTPIEYETKEVARRKRDDEVSNESDVHHRLYIGNATEGIRIVALHAVAKLIDDERDDEAGHHKGYFIIVRKPTADIISQ